MSSEEFRDGMADLGRIRSAWSVLAQGSVPAARTLVELSTGARSEFVRVQAASTVLDRVGLGGVQGVVVDVAGMAASDRRAPVDGRGAAAAILAARMAALGAADGERLTRDLDAIGDVDGDGDGDG